MPERILEYLLGRVSPEGPTRHFGAAHFGARRQPAAVFTAGGTRGRRALLRLRKKRQNLTHTLNTHLLLQYTNIRPGGQF